MAQALSEAPSELHRIEKCAECRETQWCLNFGQDSWGPFYCDSCDKILTEQGE